MPLNPDGTWSDYDTSYDQNFFGNAMQNQNAGASGGNQAIPGTNNQVVPETNPWAQTQVDPTNQIPGISNQVNSMNQIPGTNNQVIPEINPWLQQNQVDVGIFPGANNQVVPEESFQSTIPSNKFSFNAAQYANKFNGSGDMYSIDQWNRTNGGDGGGGGGLLEQAILNNNTTIKPENQQIPEKATPELDENGNPSIKEEEEGDEGLQKAGQAISNMGASMMGSQYNYKSPF